MVAWMVLVTGVFQVLRESKGDTDNGSIPVGVPSPFRVDIHQSWRPTDRLHETQDRRHQHSARQDIHS